MLMVTKSKRMPFSPRTGATIIWCHLMPVVVGVLGRYSWFGSHYLILCMHFSAVLIRKGIDLGKTKNNAFRKKMKSTKNS